MGKEDPATFFNQVYDLVRRIPPGRVTTYGTIAILLAGRPGAARAVGWALHALPAEMVPYVPWWRVINASGRISAGGAIDSGAEQRARLEDEGVAFGAGDRVDLEAYGWFGEGCER